MIHFNRLTGARAVRGMIVDATLGAVCGALCGTTIGSFGFKVHSDVSGRLPIVGYWALSVALIAVLVGTVNRFIEAVETSDRSATTREGVAVPPEGLTRTRRSLESSNF